MGPIGYKVWLVLAIGLAAIGCCVHGSGDLEKEIRSIENFRHVRLDVPGNLHITNGETSGITIKTDDNIIDRISTKVDGDTLVIKPKRKNQCLEPTQLTLTVSTPDLGNLDIDGSGDIVVEDAYDAGDMRFRIDGSGDMTAKAPITAKTVTIRIDGSGDVYLDLEAIEIDTGIDGSGDVELVGTASTHTINIDGSGNIEARDLLTEITRIEIDGSGTCYVNASNALYIDIDGSGDVYYTGNPSIDQSISGSGSVRSFD